MIKQSGVYKIVCTATRKVYVGSTLDLRQRQRDHIALLRRGQHHSVHLQRAWNKYGEAAFVHELIELVPEQDLRLREQYWIDQLRAANSRYGFNMTATAVTSYGYKLSAVTRSRMSKTRAKTYIVRDPAGHEQRIRNLSAFCQEHSLCQPVMSSVAHGKYVQHKGWECRLAHQSREAWLATLPQSPDPVFRAGKKRCSICRAYKDYAEFNADRSQSGGLAVACRNCTKQKQHESYIKNKERRKAYSKDWRLKHRERLQQQRRVRYAKNPEHYRQKRRDYLANKRLRSRAIQ